MFKKLQFSTSFLFLLGILTFSSVAQADYTPPPQQERAGDYAKSTGIRGELACSLTLLAPKVYVGQTASVTPTFAWFIGDYLGERDMDFRLFEFDNQGNIKQRGTSIKLQSQAGINQLSFPINQLPLTVGKKYLWQVAIRQNNNSWLVQKAEFKVVELPTNLQEELNYLTPSEKAEVYAAAGFWYDGLTESLKTTQKGELNAQTIDFIRSLVQSEMVETLGLSESETEHNQHLSQIVDYYETSQ
jgi:hypothetical protein